MTESLAVVPFLYEGAKTVRAAKGPDGEPWFVMADLCAVLEIKNPRVVSSRMDQDEVSTGVVKTENLGKRDVTIVSEAGMYEIVMRSNRSEAKAFRRWLTHDVLPAIRKTGRYLTPEAVEEVQELRRETQRTAEAIRSSLAKGNTRAAQSSLDSLVYAVDNEFLACLVTGSRTQL